MEFNVNVNISKNEKVNVRKLLEDIKSLNHHDKEQLTKLILTITNVDYTINNNGTWIQMNQFDKESLKNIKNFVDICNINNELFTAFYFILCKRLKFFLNSPSKMPRISTA